MNRRSVVVHTYHHTHLRQPHWTATLGNFKPGDPSGFADTEAEAVMDLYTQIAEREAALEEEHE
jgi:hypothetical protein